MDFSPFVAATSSNSIDATDFSVGRDPDRFSFFVGFGVTN
jgi:hypothetical protein